MSRCFYFVFTQPKAGRDDEFNHWYSNRHIHDLVAIPGIVAAQRYHLLDPATGEATPDYLAIYEFSDVDQAIAGIAERRGTDRMPSTDAINREMSKGVVFKPSWEVDEDWRFGRGRLDLLKFDGGLNSKTLPAGPGILFVNERQSRPGVPAFDLACFSRTERGSADLSIAAVSRLNALIAPIAERVVAPA